MERALDQLRICHDLQLFPFFSRGRIVRGRALLGHIAIDCQGADVHVWLQVFLVIMWPAHIACRTFMIKEEHSDPSPAAAQHTRKNVDQGHGQPNPPVRPG